MKVEQISEKSFEDALDIIASALYDEVSPWKRSNLAIKILMRIIQTLEKR